MLESTIGNILQSCDRARSVWVPTLAVVLEVTELPSVVFASQEIALEEVAFDVIARLELDGSMGSWPQALPIDCRLPHYSTAADVTSEGFVLCSTHGLSVGLHRMDLVLGTNASIVLGSTILDVLSVPEVFDVRS